MPAFVIDNIRSSSSRPPSAPILTQTIVTPISLFASAVRYTSNHAPPALLNLRSFPPPLSCSTYSLFPDCSGICEPCPLSRSLSHPLGSSPAEAFRHLAPVALSVLLASTAHSCSLEMTTIVSILITVWSHHKRLEFFPSPLSPLIRNILTWSSLSLLRFFNFSHRVLALTPPQKWSSEVKSQLNLSLVLPKGSSC